MANQRHYCLIDRCVAFHCCFTRWYTIEFEIEFLRENAERSNTAGREAITVTARNSRVKYDWIRGRDSEVIAARCTSHWCSTLLRDVDEQRRNDSQLCGVSTSMLYCRCRPNDPGVQSGDATKFAFQHSNLRGKPSSFWRMDVRWRHQMLAERCRPI